MEGGHSRHCVLYGAIYSKRDERDFDIPETVSNDNGVRIKCGN